MTATFKNFVPPVLSWFVFVLNLAVVLGIKEEYWLFLRTEVLFGRESKPHKRIHQTIWHDSDFSSCSGVAVDIYTNSHLWRVREAQI